jgi:threonine dehydrogenase-like Zn-dependent dehydrogenase
MISLRVHNVLDYVIAAVLVATPFLFGFADIDAARNFFFAGGLALATYSLFTDYYYSVAKIIPLGVHMAMDVIIGIAAMLAPAMFGYSDLLTGAQQGVHFVLGLGAIGLVALTYPKSGRITGARRDSERPELRRVA